MPIVNVVVFVYWLFLRTSYSSSAEWKLPHSVTIRISLLPKKGVGIFLQILVWSRLQGPEAEYSVFFSFYFSYQKQKVFTSESINDLTVLHSNFQ